MRLERIIGLLLLCFVFILSGCVVRTYKLTRDRIDQDLSAGNRGYLKGTPAQETAPVERKATRTTNVVEIELHPLIKFDNKPKAKPIETRPEETTEGNRGFISESYNPQPIAETAQSAKAAGSLEKYKVEKNDTLQKISQKFYGTTKKWTKIYEANKDKMKGPNKIYPGQIIDIPVE